MIRAAAAAAGALHALAAALPATAGLFDDEEARRRIEMLRKELALQGNDNEARIAKLEVHPHRQVRRAQLCLLLGFVGKAATLRERRTNG